MKSLLVVILFLSFLSVSAQQEFPILAKNSFEFINAANDRKIEDVYINSNNKVVVIYPNDEKKKYDKDEVWGYRNRKGIAYRLYERKEYEIRQMEGIIIYETPVTAIVGELIYNDKKYYFSNGPDEPVYKLNYENLEKAFADNPTFLEIIKQKFKNKDLWRHKDSSFEIVQAKYEAIKK